MEYGYKKIYENLEITEPIAEEITKMLVSKKNSYLECFEALEIAKEKLLLNYPMGDV